MTSKTQAEPQSRAMSEAPKSSLYPTRSNGKHPGGRPRERPDAYNEEAIKLFFARLAQGMKVREAADFADCPPHDQLYQRSAIDPEFKTRFLYAREQQQDALVDHTLEIADNATQENWQVARLRIQAIQWRAARLASKIYGEKSQLNVIVNDALSDRLTAALKRQRELASGVQIDGVVEEVPALAAPSEDKT